MSDPKMGNTNSSNNSWTIVYEEIKSKHDSAYLLIAKAITLEEQGRLEEAIENYKIGIQFIDEALRIQVTCPDNPDFTWERARVMVQKMKKTRAEALSRILSIQPPPDNNSDEPPSYEEAISNPSSPTTQSPPCTYSELAKALTKLKIEDLEMETNLIYLHDGVQLYFISSNGEVSSTSESQTLKIISVESEVDGTDTPKAILQIGDWVYPLIPGVSPCYRSNYGAFILPNVYSDQPGASIGIILPSDADADVYDFLENILYGIVGKYKPVHLQEVPTQSDTSEMISAGIITGASYLSKGFIKGAEKISDLLNYGTPKLINQIKGADEPKKIPARVSKGLEIAENGTSKAAEVTGYVANQIGTATMKLGQFLAPHIEKQGKRLLTSGFNMSEQEANAKMRGVWTVTAGAVEGFSTVYHGLESSAVILGNNLKNNTVKVVTHRYGEPAGAVAGGTFNTVGNVLHIHHNTKMLAPKRIVKNTAKETAKIMSGSKVNCTAGPSTSRVVISEIHESKPQKMVIEKKL